jgi:hypothetical protein
MKKYEKGQEGADQRAAGGFHESSQEAGDHGNGHGQDGGRNQEDRGGYR